MQDVIGRGAPDAVLSENEIGALLAEGLRSFGLEGLRVLFVIPDGTRTAPLPLLFRRICAELRGRVKQLDFLVALGTHIPLSLDARAALVGETPDSLAANFPGVRIFNHEWQDPQTFVELGRIDGAYVSELSGGRFTEGAPVRVNRLVLEYDRLVVCGPVFPHEVAGFSGGNKYFVPGVAGREIIDLSHWVGALATSMAVIGVKHTATRAIIDRAAGFIPTPKHNLAFVVQPGSRELCGLFAGSMDGAWSAAAELSARVHIRRVARPFHTVLAVMPAMYEDFWTAAKGMYKLEPVVADGGELIIYAPHVSEISYAHGKVLDQVGYHIRDVYVRDWPRYRNQPWGVLAHATHCKGLGQIGADGVERPRIRLSLATRIPEERCTRLNLGYRDPATIRPADFAGREHDGVLLVERAGEQLYRLTDS